MPKPYIKIVKDPPPIVKLADDLHRFITQYGLLKSRITMTEPETFSIWFKWMLKAYAEQQGLLPNKMFDPLVDDFVETQFNRIGSFSSKIKFRRIINALVAATMAV